MTGQMGSDTYRTRVLAADGSLRPSPRRHPSTIVGRALVVLGLLCLLVFASDFGLGLHKQQQLDQAWQRQVAAGFPNRDEHSTGPAIDPRPVDGVDFAIRVPRIDYFAAAAEGIDSHVLAGGPGHYPEMAWPGQPGNVGVAAHNVYWIRFNDLQPGDQIVLETRWGNYTYKVSGKRIVNPDDRTILVQAGRPRLTLTTCWPLWAGAFAGQRLVVFADQVDPATGP